MMVIVIDAGFLILALCFAVGFVAGRIVMALEYAFLKPKYESYKVIIPGEEFSPRPVNVSKNAWHAVDASHAVAANFYRHVHVLDPHYHRELSAEEMKVNYRRGVAKNRKPAASAGPRAKRLA